MLVQRRLHPTLVHWPALMQCVMPSWRFVQNLSSSTNLFGHIAQRAGVLRVNEICEAFSVIELFSSQPRPAGPRMMIVTNAGGPGVLATDALDLGGGILAPLSPETMAEYNSFLPEAWSHNNPVDILGDASAEKYAHAIQVAAKEPNADAVLCILTPQDMTNPTATAIAIKEVAKTPEAKAKLSLSLFCTGRVHVCCCASWLTLHLPLSPVMCSFMGGHDVEEGVRILTANGIPNFAYPDLAVRVFNYLHKGTALVNLLQEPCPEFVATGIDVPAARAAVQRILAPALAARRTFLTEYESKKILAAYGLPAGQTELAHTPEEAVEWATKIGFPVVVKIHSETIIHKSDYGGVKVNINNADEVRRAWREIKESVVAKTGSERDFLGVVVMPMVRLKDAYEIILGCNCDKTFGPTVLFGMGGILVEVFKDRALGLAPLNRAFAQRLVEHTKIYTALKGVRGKRPVDQEQLLQVIMRFSQLVSDHPVIRELDINPLLVCWRALLIDGLLVFTWHLRSALPTVSWPWTRASLLPTSTRCRLRSFQRRLSPALAPLRTEWQTRLERLILSLGRAIHNALPCACFFGSLFHYICCGVFLYEFLVENTRRSLVMY